MKNRNQLRTFIVAITAFAVGGVAANEYLHRPKTVELSVTGMSCAGCAATIEKKLANLPGVSDVEISHEAATAKLTIDGWSNTTQGDVVAAIEEAGDYEVAN